MTARKPIDLDEALDDAVERAIEDINCPECTNRGWTVRVTAYGTDGRIDFSQYACDECSDTVLGIVRRLHPGAEVYDLPGKAHPQKLPL